MWTWIPTWPEEGIFRPSSVWFRLMTEVPACQLDMHLAKDIPDDRAIPLEASKLTPGSPEAKVAMLHNMPSMCDGEIRLHARWTRYEN